MSDNVDTAAVRAQIAASTWTPGNPLEVAIKAPPLDAAMVLALCDEVDRLRNEVTEWSLAAESAEAEVARLRTERVQVGTVAGFGRVNVLPTVVWPDEGEPVYVYCPEGGD